VNILWHNN